MILNGKTYQIPELTFNAVCRLEELGVSLTEIDKKPMAAIRGFIALATGSLESAGNELEAHILSGGKLEEITQEITKAVSGSGFFQKLAESASPAKKAKVKEIPAE